MWMIPVLQNWAWGGISDDKFVGTPNSFQEVVNLEVRENPKTIKLQFAAVKDTGNTIEDLPMCMETIQSTWTIVVFWDTWKIYTKISGTWAKNTYSSASKVLWCKEFNGKLFFATATTLFSIPVANIDTNFTGDVTTVGTFDVGNTNQHPMLSTGWTLYIWDWYKIANVNVSWTFTPDTLTVNIWEEIRALTNNSASMKIYTRKPSTSYGKCYLRGRQSELAEQVWDWDWLSIQQVVSKDGNDYVVAWDNKQRIYYTDGIWKQSLKKIPTVSTTPYNMTLFNDNVVFSTDSGIYTWGAYTKDYPQVLTLDYKISIQTGVNTIGTIHNSNGTLYIWWKNVTSTVTTYGIDIVDWTTYALQWYLVTRVYYANMAFLNKNPQERYNTFKKLITNQSIKLYTKEDFATDWSLIRTIDTTNTTMFDRSQYSKNFNYLEIKIELNWPWTSTPELIESFIRFDENWL